MPKFPIRLATFASAGFALLALMTLSSPRAQDAGSEATPEAQLPAVAAEILLHPNLSPDGKMLAFSFDGDIWEVSSEGGDARRLTITEDNDFRPLYSPDGKWLAFQSNRFGSSDVFIMPAGGGESRRLTFDDVGNTPTCWLPDSSGVLYTGFRQEFGASLHCAPITGGNCWPVIRTGYMENISDASISVDGTKLAYVRRGGSTSYRQRGYVGSSNNDLWLCDFDGVFTSNHRQLTNSLAHDFAPQFVQNEAVVYCTFDDGNGGADRLSHLAVKPLDGDAEAIPFSVKDIRSLSMAAGIVVVATGNYGGWGLYRFVEETDETTRLKINLRRDWRNVRKTVSTINQSEGFSVSPDGKKIAFLAGYDVFLMPTEAGGVPKQLTNTAVREHNIQWAADSEHISFTRSNVTRSECRIMNTKTGQEGYLNASGGVNTHSGLFSPDGKWFYYVKNNFTICRSPIRKVDPMESHAEGDNLLSLLVDSRREVVIVEHNFVMFSGMGTWGDGVFGLSPDGRWLSFVKENERYDRELWVCDMDADWPLMRYLEGVKTTEVELASGTPQEARQLISMFGDVGSYGATRDGKLIAFSVNTEGGYDNGDANIWTIETRREPIEFAEDKLDEALKAAEPKPAAKPVEAKEGDKPEAKSEEKPEAKPEEKPAAKLVTPKTKPSDIDFNDIRRRLSPATSLAGNENWIVGAQSHFFFTSANNVWALNVNNGRPSTRQLTTNNSPKSGLELSKDGKTLWFLDRGVITAMNTANNGLSARPFSVVQRRNVDDLRALAMQEAHGILRDWFYDKNYHGVDLEGTFSRYGEALNAVSTGDEYGALMSDLFGELNASHQGYTAPDARSDGYKESIGWLGLAFDERGMAEGKFVVRRIVRDGPCDQAGVDVQIGDVLTHINGVRITKETPIETLLLDTVGKRTDLVLIRVIEGKPLPEGVVGMPSPVHEVKVKPITYQQHFGLYYGDWTHTNQERVHAESDNKLGYVHIQSMDKASLIKFKHELGAEMLGRDGVIIDVRHNGGGRTAVQILDILYSKPWLQSVTRHKTDKLSENVKGSVKLEKPTLMLCNQNSFSNAEMITEGFKELGLGKVVGMPTAGGVIWTWSSYSLSDGAGMRVTARGVYDMRGQNLENNGRTPDIQIDITPSDVMENRDPQLSRGVKELLAQSKK